MEARLYSEIYGFDIRSGRLLTFNGLVTLIELIRSVSVLVGFEFTTSCDLSAGTSFVVLADLQAKQKCFGYFQNGS